MCNFKLTRITVVENYTALFQLSTGHDGNPPNSIFSKVSVSQKSLLLKMTVSSDLLSFGFSSIINPIISMFITSTIPSNMLSRSNQNHFKVNCAYKYITYLGFHEALLGIWRRISGSITLSWASVFSQKEYVPECHWISPSYSKMVKSSKILT